MIDVFQYLTMTTVIALGVMLSVWTSNAFFFFTHASSIQEMNKSISLVRIATAVNTTALFFLLLFVSIALLMYALQIDAALIFAVASSLICKWRYNPYLLKLYDFKFNKKSFFTFAVLDMIFFSIMLVSIPYTLI